MAQATRTPYDVYVSLLQQGVPSMQAYRQAFPQGVQTGQKTPKQQAKEQQRAGYARVGGALVGALAVKGAGQALSGERVFGETRDNLGRLIGLGEPATPTGLTATRVAGPTTPTGLSAARVTELPAGSTTTPTGEILAPGGKVVDPQTGMTTGDWAQGALGVIQVIQGTKEFKGDKIAGALGTTAGLANIGTQVSKQFNLGGTETLGDVAGAVGAAYGAYGLGKMALKSGDYSKSDKGSLALQGAGYGASIGGYFGGAPGAAIGAALGGAYGFLSGFTGSGKGLRQKVRDKWREAMLENNVGFFDENYKGKLPDGTEFDWGKDKFTFGKKEGDIDLENPVVGKAAAYGNVMAALQGAVDRKPREAIATQFLAAGTANTKDDQEKMRGNFKSFFGKLGMDTNSAQQHLKNMYDEGKLNDNEYQVFSNDLTEMLR